MKQFYPLKLLKPTLKPYVITGVLCAVFSLHASRASAQSLNISVTDKPLKEVFAIIEQQSGYNFVYGDDYLDGIANVTLQMSNAPLSVVLGTCLNGTGLWYRIEGKEIIIVSPKYKEPERPKPPRTVYGQVLDDKKQPLPGVQIVAKETGRGDISGIDGQFSIRIPGDGATLKFSYLGMEPQEVRVLNQDNLNITMRQSTTTIDNVIVTAYGVLQKKEDFVGSATQVSSNEIKSLPTLRVDRMLEGLVPGFQIKSQSEGSVAGRDRFSVRIRGESSLNASGEPLWIIDGVRMYTGGRTNQMNGVNNSVSPLSMLNPQDIESMTVLKDATQTSIYGADGANGIVLITTKKGIKGKPEIRANLKYGLSTDDKSTRPKMLNGPQFLMLAKEAWLNSGKPEAAFPWQDNDLNSYSTTDTDWYDEYLRIGQRMQADISVRTGSERSSNFISLGLYDENPMLKGNSTKRLSARINSDVNVTDNLRFELRLNAVHTTDQIFGVGRDFYEFAPIFSPYYDGTSEYRLLNKATTTFTVKDINPYTGLEILPGEADVYYPMEYRFYNTLPEIDQNDVKSRSLQLLGTASLTWQILPSLALSSQLGVRHLGINETEYFARTNWSGMSSDRVKPEVNPTQPVIMTPVGYSYAKQSNASGWSNENRLSFGQTFGKHTAGASAILELRSSELRNLGSQGSGFPNDKMKDVSYATDDTRRGSGTTSFDKQLSYAGEVSYNYDSRYYLVGNVRNDGSSTFGEYHEWATFYSAGASWNIHNEPFFNVPQIGVLKLRGSFGVVGNSRTDAVAKGTYSMSTARGYRGSVGGTMGKAPNPGLTWESVYKGDIGLDLSLFRDAIFLTFDWYNHKTVDVISSLPSSNLTGERTMDRNMGVIRNSGFEILLTTKNFDRKNFSWKTTLTMSHNQNKLVSLYQDAYTSFFDQGFYVGYEKNVWTNLKWAGVDPRDGAPMWYDKNGNLTRTYSYDNRVKADYSRYPTVYGAIANTWVWKNFEVYMQINYSIGGWGKASILNYIRDGGGMNSFVSPTNQPVELLDRWQTPGQVANIPVLIDGASRNASSYNDRAMMNMTHFRLSNIAVYYDLPKRITEKMKMQRFAVSFTLDNAYFFSPDQSRTRNSYKTAFNTVSQERIFSLGVELGF